jgi:aerobic C4-dicarboxylate transport protein
LGAHRHPFRDFSWALFPGERMQMEIVGKTFVDLIKLFIAPIIFLTIVLGISSMGDLRKVGRMGQIVVVF